MIRTRFAPSPTGFLHIGSARTALFCWAFAQKNKGAFILRIEDTDIERSTQESVDSIINAMDWLGLTYDEGPYYQTKRMSRYKEVLEQLLMNDKAYYCYCTKEELDLMREEQKAKGLKPKYDRRCFNSKTLKSGINPVIRFKNPDTGSVIWHDLVKGKIEISNSELDDLIIARSDGTPTYNFCVVIDDLDMQITHVVRGDDHVNNTPRQINLFYALGVEVPIYAHLPMILREDGKKMSKRTDSVSVMQYKDMGILPEALLNYLARLCWGHGNDEVFSIEQFVKWFELDKISSSPAKFDIKKLYWVNKEHIQKKPNQKLADLVFKSFHKKNIIIDDMQKLIEIINSIKLRVDNLNSLVQECSYFYQYVEANELEKSQYLTSETISILNKFAINISSLENWSIEAIKVFIKEFCENNNIKMPQLGMPLRLKLCGTIKAPAIDMIIYFLGKSEVLRRLKV